MSPLVIKIISQINSRGRERTVIIATVIATVIAIAIAMATTIITT